MDRSFKYQGKPPSAKINLDDTTAIDVQEDITKPEINADDEVTDKHLSRKEQEGTEAEAKDKKMKSILSRIPHKISTFLSQGEQEDTLVETKDKKKKRIFSMIPWKTKQNAPLAAAIKIDDSPHKFPG